VRSHLLLATIAFLVAPALAAAQNDGIAERLAAEIRAALPSATVSVPDPDGLNLTFGGQTQPVGIGSLRAICAQQPSNCEAAIHGYRDRAVAYMLESAPLQRDQLRIVVRSRAYLDSMRGQMAPSDDFVLEPLAGELVSACYRDLPQARRPIISSDLPLLQLDQRSALSACENGSQRALAPLAPQWRDLPPQGIGLVQSADDVTGYLARPQDWEPLARRFGGLVVAVPTIDTILYVRGATARDVDALRTLATQMHAQATVPVSAQVFRWSDHGWVLVE